ncbi:DUF6359 domain-containing protein [Barnesiella viscericola]|uniref:DUF6359 domain-containing protein n=1 Tax=Barnesiella viscericola TaxID=397865 RepID=UPI0025A3A107|nr:DUF6359 domain-containing protein [Barnesiella viscericola]MDM8267981.1 DUF6359 domain-containing protein [Barnesiella viscericola]
MKKMRKFAWIFMAAMTVAGFSACSNSDDDVLPGMGGGNGGGPTTTPSVVITDTIYQFNDLKGNYPSISDYYPEWTTETVLPADQSNKWKGYVYNSTNDKYLRASAYFNNTENAGIQHELWLFSPALNVKDATNKNFSFYTEGSNWQETSTLEVYVLNEPKSTASGKEKLNVKIATSSDGNYKWVASGDISLEGKGDIVYIGFCYKGIGESCTTYCLDDFAFGRAQVEHFIGEPEPTPDVDWSKALTVADALTQADNSTFAVKGHIVGCIKNNPSKTFYESFAEAQAAGDIEWAGAAAFTGYSQVFIADDAAETDGTKCILVKLNDTDAAKALRNEAKLEGNPDRIGMTIYVQGLKKANYGLPGVREITAYKVGE